MKIGKAQGEIPAPRPRHALLELVESDSIVPDTRFYDAVLDVFGRRPGMVQRSKSHSSRSEVLSQLRRGYKRAAKDVYAATPPEVNARSEIADAAATPHEEALDPAAQPRPSSPQSIVSGERRSTNDLLNIAVSRITHNSRGRRTSINPDPFLVRILLDMEALSLPIPVAFRWVLAYCALHAPATAQVDGEVSVPDSLQNKASKAKSGKAEEGAFSAWRGPRIKTVGLIARRPNSAAPATVAKQKVGEPPKRGK